jgi:glycosyltransferase involved in cell wall biosynthesis
LRPLVVTHSLDLGGAQLYLLDLLRGMHNQAPFNCTVLTMADGPLRAPLEDLGFRVHVTTPMPLGDATRYAGRVEELAAWAKPGVFDLVLVNTTVAFHGVELASALGIPAVWAIHESYSPSMLWALIGDLDPEVRRRAEEALHETAAALFEADATRRLYEAAVGAERCVTLPYGVDFAAIDAERSRFDRTAARRRRGVPDDAQVVLCVGTIEPRKAQVPLVQAFGLIAERHPRARLVLIGARDDAYTRALEDYVATCSFRSRVEILPVLPDLGPWYGLSDLFVCASDVESLPRSVLESMAWGTPVVAADVFGLPELIEDGETGWLFPTRDVRAMADAIDRALGESEDELQRIATAAQQLVHERHALGSYVSACRELFKQVAAGEWPAVADAQAE